MKRFRKINPLSDEDTFECLILAGLGFSDFVIKRKTGLTTGQISYRLKKWELQRKHYRNADSQVAQHIIKSGESVATLFVKERVKQKEKKK